MTHPIDVNTLNPLLRAHALEPRHNRPLARVSACAELHDHLNGATVRIVLHVEDDRVIDASFQEPDHLVVRGCASFALHSIIGQTLHEARRMQSTSLMHYLRLEDRFKWCAELVVGSLRCALKDLEQRRRDGATARTRQAHRNPCHSPFDEVEAERFYIVGILTHLLLYFELGMSAHHVHQDRSSQEREGLLCDLASVTPILPSLPDSLRRVIHLVGLQGMTEREAAATLGLSDSTVHKRLWKAAALIQRVWRRQGSDPPGMTEAIRNSGNPRSGTGAPTRSKTPSARTTPSGRRRR